MKRGELFFIFIIYWKFMFLFSKNEVKAAVPIDIVTEKPGHTYRPIIMFIPDKKPIISRRNKDRPKMDYDNDDWNKYNYKDWKGPKNNYHYDDWKGPKYNYHYDDWKGPKYNYHYNDWKGPKYNYDYDDWRGPKYNYHYDNWNKPHYHDDDWYKYKHAEKYGDWYRVKYQDSHYVDDLEVPFLRAKSRNPVPSIGHGVDIKFGQVKPILKRMILDGYLNNEVMEAVKRWQYDNRYNNTWKQNYKRKIHGNI